MKVYVDELPIKVRQSVIHYDDGKTNCLILEFSEDVEPSEICETKALKQQVKKQVCEKIKQNADIEDWEQINGYTLGKILDQIQGEKEV